MLHFQVFRPLLVAFAFAFALPAQAQSLRIESSGQPCNAQMAPANLLATPSFTAGMVDFEMTRTSPCCGTFLVGQWLLIGANSLPRGTTLPIFLPGCEFRVQPFVALISQQYGGPGRWPLSFAGVPAGSTLFFQGLNQFFEAGTGLTSLQSSLLVRVDVN